MMNPFVTGDGQAQGQQTQQATAPKVVLRPPRLQIGGPGYGIPVMPEPCMTVKPEALLLGAAPSAAGRLIRTGVRRPVGNGFQRGRLNMFSSGNRLIRAEGRRSLTIGMQNGEAHGRFAGVGRVIRAGGRRSIGHGVPRGSTRTRSRKQENAQRWGRGSEPTREQLDKELDEYAAARNRLSLEALDAELDRYQAVTTAINRRSAAESEAKDMDVDTV
ncbi:uncharacterized protein LOC110850738 [Folsomia candida]|uniref:Chromatin target of PRMT1 protein C-terminal domain-containing protein n=1 Tax=Folsomia candida TaxID=158441 RepID=A0A226E9H6_FOLCA|nr:uncharacterized protein LOC110850738 [Folsomia candida]OXA53266.1 hypothetical protein Fcan01_11979 [Folsomia candida]